MRVPDYVLKCVSFVSERKKLDGTHEELDHEGTGFFVSMPSEWHPNQSYGYFVTAKHVAERLEGRDIAFLANKKAGGIGEVLPFSDHWIFHPWDSSVDVAVLAMGEQPDLDIVYVSTNDFLTLERILESTEFQRVSQP